MTEEEFIRNLELIAPQLDYYSKVYYVSGFDPPDIRQEIRMRLWLKKDMFDEEKASFKTWSNHIIVNLMKNLLRDADRQKRRPLNNYVNIDDVNVV